MKPSSSLFLFLILILTLNSCGFIHYMGTKDPADESPEEVTAYLKKHRFDFADHSLFLVDSLRNSLSDSLHALDTWKLERQRSQSVMQIQIYDAEGKLVNAYAQCYGPYKRLAILKKKEFLYFKQFPTNYNLTFSDQPVLWKLSSTQKEQILQAVPNNTYTFVVYWNIWSNHYSEVMLKAVKKYLKSHESNDFNIQVILVNTGMKPRGN